jgi:signal transduction histidine kinase
MRRRILVAIVGVAAVAVLLFAIPLGVTVRDLTVDGELNELERAAERVERGIEPEHIDTTSAQALAHHRGEFTVGVYARAGLRVAGKGPLHLEAELHSAVNGVVARRNGAPLKVAVPIGSGPARGVVRVTARASGVDRSVLRAWLLLSGFALAAIGAAAALAWWLSRRVDKPLAQLAVAARRIGDGDFTSRVARSGVSEIDDVASAMDTTAERLGESLDRERSFSANVSHQLRTRVAALRVTLESAALTQTSEQETIARAIEETDRLESTIDELLALARNTHVDRTELDAHALLDDVERSWRGRFAADGRTLRVAVEPATPTARASAAATRQILEVLVDNAVRHGHGEVHVTARSANDGLAIDVRDEGPGITDDPAEVFARRGPGNDGHGIGLALARALAEAEGGRLVLTRRTPGAEFTLLLPGERHPE